LFSAGLTALTAGVIIPPIVRRPEVDVQTVLAALCIYVLSAIWWAFVYEAIGSLGSTPFFAQTAHPADADYLYFSFVTQTTTGYGDFTAAGNLGRSAAVLEALIGQIYLVTIIAVLVSHLRPRNRNSQTSDG
jgi:hypothetical protein